MRITHIISFYCSWKAACPQAIAVGQIAEVTVIPGEAGTNETLTVTITGERYGLIETEAITVDVVAGEDVLGLPAAKMRDKFIPWLAADHPEFGITSRRTYDSLIWIIALEEAGCDSKGFLILNLHHFFWFSYNFPTTISY